MAGSSDAASLQVRLNTMETHQMEMRDILVSLDAKMDAMLALSTREPPLGRTTQRSLSPTQQVSGADPNLDAGASPSKAAPGESGRKVRGKPGLLVMDPTTDDLDDPEAVGDGLVDDPDSEEALTGDCKVGLIMRDGYDRSVCCRVSSLSAASRRTASSLSSPKHKRRAKRQPSFVLQAVSHGIEPPPDRLRAWHPDSRSRTVYDAFVIMAFLYDAFAVPFMVAFDMDQTDHWILWGVWITSVFWTLDLTVGFITGYRDKSAILNLDLRTTSKHYLSTWFFPDFIMVCCDWMSEIFWEVRFLRVIRIVRAVGKQAKRVYNMAQQTKVVIPSKDVHLAMDVCLLLGAILWANHVVACIWYWIGTNYLTDTDLSWLSDNKFSMPGVRYTYLTSLHWAITQMTPGSMEVFPANSAERGFNVLALFFGLLCGSTLVATLTSMMTQYKLRVQGSADMFSKMQNFLAQQEVDQGLAMAIKLQVKARLKEKPRVKQKDVQYLELAPKSLQEALWHACCMKQLSTHTFMSALNFFDAASFTTICYRCIVACEYGAEDTIFEENVPGDTLYFLSAGQLKYRPGELAAEADLSEYHARLTVKPGGFCSEPALWIDWLHLGTLEARCTSEVLKIGAPALQEVLERMPEMQDIILDYCHAFHRYLEESVRLSDLPDVVDSHELMLSMSQESRSALAAPLLKKIKGRSSKAVNVLSNEIAEGKCHIAMVGTEPMRTVFVITLRIFRSVEDHKMLVKVGEVLKDGQIIPYCTLPGIKRSGQRSSKAVVDQMLATELPELSGSVEVDFSVAPDQVPLIKNSDQFGIRTRYLRTTFTAAVKGDMPHLTTIHAMHDCRAMTPAAGSLEPAARRSSGRRTSLRNQSSISSTEQAATDLLGQQDGAIALKCEGENRAACKLYIWLTRDEFEVLSQDTALPIIKQWVQSLDCGELVAKWKIPFGVTRTVSIGK